MSCPKTYPEPEPPPEPALREQITGALREVFDRAPSSLDASWNVVAARVEAAMIRAAEQGAWVSMRTTLSPSDKRDAVRAALPALKEAP